VAATKAWRYFWFTRSDSLIRIFRLECSHEHIPYGGFEKS
jgi:hypothetical protein